MWYSIPHEKVMVEGIEHQGVIRSVACLRDKGNRCHSGICSECQRIMSSKEFEMRARRCLGKEDITNKQGTLNSIKNKLLSEKYPGKSYNVIQLVF